MGYILVPIVVPDDMDVVEFANTTPFKEVVRIIRAMALADPRIVDELRAVYEGRIASGRLFKFKIDERIGAEVALDAFAAAITTRVWEVVARYNGMYRSFADARAFVRGLGLKNMHEWREWSSSDKRPPDIPTNRNTMYRDDWVDLGDWLGSGTKSWRDVEFRSFKDVRAFVRGLGIKSKDEWFAYCKTGQKPDDVPSNINKAFPSDWKGWPAFLGTKNSGAKGVYRSFEDARAFARSLGCRSQTDWHAFCQSGERPRDIPTNPRRIYAKSGWGRVWATGSAPVVHRTAASSTSRSRRRARSFGRSGWRLRRGGIEYWQAHRTIDIPCNPSGKYRGKWWAGWPNFLGTEKRSEPSHGTSRLTTSPAVEMVFRSTMRPILGNEPMYGSRPGTMSSRSHTRTSSGGRAKSHHCAKTRRRTRHSTRIFPGYNRAERAFCVWPFNSPFACLFKRLRS